MWARCTSRTILGLLVGLLWLPACSTTINPATGRRQVVLMSKEQERQIDAEMAQRIEVEYGLIKDRELAAYVDAVGQGLAVHSPRKDVIYAFRVVEMDAPNAFALPGGHIYVSRGLLTIANSEAELANVLGHEIGHVAARHAAQQDAHSKTLGLSTLLSDVMSGGGMEQPDSESLGGSPIARFARNQEREADRIGQDLAVSAGVDPAGMADFLRTLDGVTKVDQGFSNPQTYFATHPATPERVAEATTSAQSRVWRGGAQPPGKGFGIARTRDQYLDRIEGMAVGRPASEGVFVDDRFLHPDLDFSLRFPRSWKTQNQQAQVVGISPRRDGLVLLQLHGSGNDPEVAAREYEAREELLLENVARLKIGGLPAFRAEAVVPTSFGRVRSEITFIAYAGLVYRLIAGVETKGFHKYRGIFRKFAHSFRPLTEEDRQAITEQRLRLVTARRGETLEALSKRSGNTWDLTYTAVVNGLLVGEPLRPGRRVKVAIREPYRAASDAPSETPSTAPSPSADSSEAAAR